MIKKLLVIGGAGFIGSNQRLSCDEGRVGRLVVPTCRDLKITILK